MFSTPLVLQPRFVGKPLRGRLEANVALLMLAVICFRVNNKSYKIQTYRVTLF